MSIVCVCMYVDASGVVLSNHKCRVCTYVCMYIVGKAHLCVPTHFVW